MDQVITEHLKRITIKPRPTSWFRAVAQELGKPTTAHKAKAVVRSTISKGQVAASNDNIKGLRAQAEKEKKGGLGKGASKHANPKLVHGLTSAALTGKIPFEVFIPEPITEGIRTTVKDKIRSEVPKSVRWMGLEKTGIAKNKAKSRIKEMLPSVLEDRGIEEYLVGRGAIPNAGGWCCPLC